MLVEKIYLIILFFFLQDVIEMIGFVWVIFLVMSFFMLLSRPGEKIREKT